MSNYCPLKEFRITSLMKAIPTSKSNYYLSDQSARHFSPESKTNRMGAESIGDECVFDLSLQPQLVCRLMNWTGGPQVQIAETGCSALEKVLIWNRACRNSAV